MFTQSSKDMEQTQSAETFIGPSVKLEGNFDADGDIVVEGLLTGNITTRGDVRVGPQAVIEAKVSAKNAQISGKLKGNLIVDNSLKLASTASIHGDVKTSSLTVEEGAVINGKISMKKGSTVKETPITFSPSKQKASKSPKNEDIDDLEE